MIDSVFQSLHRIGGLRYDPSFDRDDFRLTCKMITKFYVIYLDPQGSVKLTRTDIVPHLSVIKRLAIALEAKILRENEKRDKY